jgi:hypothetical protein
MKFNIYDINQYCVASDTDSIFIMAEPLIIKRWGNNYINEINEEDIIEYVKEIALDYEHKINNFVTKRAKEILNIHHNQIGFKTETIIKSAYWSGKRRYAQYIINKEGIPVEELDIKGMDVMKSNFPPYFREFGEELIKMILFGVPKNEIDKYVLDFKQSIPNIDLKKLLKPTGLKKLDEYIESPPRVGELFSVLKKKCPINSKSAIISNDILRFKGLNKKYPEFTVGDKMYIAKLKSNPYKIDVIGLNGYNDAPEIMEIVDKYIDKEGLFDSILRNKIENIYEDLKWELNFNTFIKDFFNF